MEPLLQWGLESIRLVQSYANPPLTAVMRMITGIGAAPAYLILLPFMYWCIDEKKGLRLAVTVLISVWINIFLKLLFDQPRPFFEGYDPSVGMISERMGGLPSGHAQNSLVTLFIIASWIQKKRAYIAAALLCFLIGFSRVYLGVHFPTDVLAGWLLGGIILLVYFLIGGTLDSFFAKGDYRMGMIITAVLSFAMILYLPEESLLMPAGTLLGIGAGYCLNRRYVGFKTGSTKHLFLLVRFLVGVTGMLLIFAAVGKIIPHDSANRNLFNFIRFTLAGVWVSVGAPWVYVRLHLSGCERKEQ